jgi:hypothetical protein
MMYQGIDTPCRRLCARIPSAKIWNRGLSVTAPVG